MTAQIITFYSPTGDEHSSAILVNLGWLLASAGHRVLLVDWDLDHPVLHRHLGQFLVDQELTCTEGLLDMLREFMCAALTPSTEPADEGWHRAYADTAPYTVGVDHRFQRSGCLVLMPVGRQGPGYARDVSTFDWGRFYGAFGGGIFLESVKDQMRAQYDYVLINGAGSRGDAAGPPIVQMPDVLVVFHSDDAQGKATFGDVERRVGAYRRDLDRGSCVVIPAVDKTDVRTRLVHPEPLVDLSTALASGADITELIRTAVGVPV